MHNVFLGNHPLFTNFSLLFRADLLLTYTVHPIKVRQMINL